MSDDTAYGCYTSSSSHGRCRNDSVASPSRPLTQAALVSAVTGIASAYERWLLGDISRCRARRTMEDIMYELDPYLYSEDRFPIEDLMNKNHCSVMVRLMFWVLFNKAPRRSLMCFSLVPSALGTHVYLMVPTGTLDIDTDGAWAQFTPESAVRLVGADLAPRPPTTEVDWYFGNPITDVRMTNGEVYEIEINQGDVIAFVARDGKTYNVASPGVRGEDDFLLVIDETTDDPQLKNPPAAEVRHVFRRQGTYVVSSDPNDYSAGQLQIIVRVNKNNRPDCRKKGCSGCAKCKKC